MILVAGDDQLLLGWSLSNSGNLDEGFPWSPRWKKVDLN